MLGDIIESLNDPQRRHAAVVHMPIALSMLGVIVALISTIGFKSGTLRWLTFITFAMLAGTAYFATLSGDDAHAELGMLSATASEIVEDHEVKADWAWKLAAGVALISLVGLAPKTKVRVIASLVTLLGAVFTAGWVGLTGHLGGSLVYDHGLGTPQPVVAVTEPEDDDPGAGGETGAGDEPESPAFDDPRAAYFVEHAWPVLRDNCIRCHNPNRLRRVGNLDMTTIAGLLEGGVGGPAIVPGNPAESMIIQAMRYEIEDLEMPADDDQLAPEVVALLDRWIAEGAVWAEVDVTVPAEKDEEGDGDDDGEG